MSDHDVPPDEMSWDPTIDDEAFDALLEGDPAAAEANLDLTRFVADMRTAFPADAPAAEAHLAAIAETARLSADNGDPATMPASNADAPAAQVSWLPKRKGNHMKERKWRILVLRCSPSSGSWARPARCRAASSA
jgi:hypothetical protein